MTEAADKEVMADGTEPASSASNEQAEPKKERGVTVHGEEANAGHRVLTSDDAEVEA